MTSSVMRVLVAPAVLARDDVAWPPAALRRGTPPPQEPCRDGD